MDTIETTESVGKHRVFHHVDKVAAAIIWETVAYLMPNPCVRSTADLFDAEVFAHSGYSPKDFREVGAPRVAAVDVLTSATENRVNPKPGQPTAALMNCRRLCHALRAENLHSCRARGPIVVYLNFEPPLDA